MDKLEPILKQKFWILLGVGVILTITGWWMATGSLSAAITQRKADIESAENGIPSGEIPNNDWTSKLAEINTRQEEMVTVVERQMWEQQAATMFWPESVQEFVSQLEFRGEFLGQDGLVARDLYRSSYIFSAQEVWMKVRPIMPDGTGIVLFPFEAMPQEKWGSLAPKSPEIWDAQEDLWLLSPILDAIREVNGGENGTRLDASIHVINKLELMGGERATGDAGSAAGAGGGGSESYDGGMGGGAESMAFGSGNSNRQTGGKAVKSEFAPEEEFGTTGRKGGGGGGGGGMFGGSASGAEYSADAGAGGGDGGGGPAAVRRYVDDDEALPYKTRAFYLSVLMDHRRVPHLIGELTAGGNSPWPMEIVRVQVARQNPDDATGQSMGGNGMMAMANGGAMGSGAPMGSGFTSDSPDYAATAATPTTEDYGSSGGSGEGFGTPTMPGQLAGQLSLATALQDPFVSKVTIAGLIYLYKPVAPPTATEAATPEAETPEAAAPAEMTEEPAVPAEAGEAVVTEPADPAAAPTEPAPAPAADPNATPPTNPATATAAEAGATPVPAAPAATTPTESPPAAPANPPE